MSSRRKVPSSGCRARVPPLGGIERALGDVFGGVGIEHFQCDAVFADFAFTIDENFLVLNPRAFDVLRRLRRAGNAYANGVVEAFFR